MKGLLYCDFLLNKKWFLGAGIITVLGTAVCFILFKSFWNGNIIMPPVCGAVQAITAFICTEWLGRSLETDIKCRFADYVLVSGVSKKTFVLVELVKNIISIATSFAMCMVMQLVLRLLDKQAFDPILLLVYILILGASRWITSLITISLRNAEKAGLIVAIGFVLFVVLPYVFIGASIDKIGSFGYCIWYLTEYLIWLGYEWVLGLLFYAVIIGVYAIVYVLFLRRIRKGDVCR